MHRFRELLKMRKAKTVPLSSKMLGPDEDEEDSKVVDIIKKYFIETSIHGPKYIFENKRHSCERLFWVFAVSIMASFGFYLIYQVNNIYIKAIFAQCPFAMGHSTTTWTS
jgi:hypothetical protein